MKRNTKIFVAIIIIVTLVSIFLVGNISKNEGTNKQDKNNVLPAKTETKKESSNIYLEISVSNARKLIKKNLTNKNLHIVDVRTPEEFSQGHIENAVNIDFYQSAFEAKISSLDKNGTYLIYCKSGGRSAKALEVFKQGNFNEVYNLIGGYTEYMK